MSNAYYTPSGNPGTGSPGQSSVVRSEFTSIQAAFDRLVPGAFYVTFATTANVAMTLPATSGTLVTADSTKTLTNTTFDTAGAGNVFKINGNAVSAFTGTGNTAVLKTSPHVTTLTVDSGGLTITAGGLTVTAGGAAITGNSTVTGTLTVTGAVNKVTITAPASGSTLTIADGKTLTASNTLTLAGTDGTTPTFGPISARQQWFEVGRATASGSSAFIEVTGIPSTVNNLMVLFNGTPNTDPAGAFVRFYYASVIDNGANYYTAGVYGVSDGTSGVLANTSNFYITGNSGNTVGLPISSTIIINNIQGTGSINATYQSNFVATSTANGVSVSGGGGSKVSHNGPINGVRILLDSGLIRAGGTLLVLGTF